MTTFAFCRLECVNVVIVAQTFLNHAAYYPGCRTDRAMVAVACPGLGDSVVPFVILLYVEVDGDGIGGLQIWGSVWKDTVVFDECDVAFADGVRSTFLGIRNLEVFTAAHGKEIRQAEQAVKDQKLSRGSVTAHHLFEESKGNGFLVFFARVLILVSFQQAL